MSFNVGEVVKLRSGSPEMTVATVDESRKVVTAIWFVDGRVEHYEFAFETLQKHHQTCDSDIF